MKAGLFKYRKPPSYSNFDWQGNLSESNFEISFN